MRTLLRVIQKWMVVCLGAGVAFAAQAASALPEVRIGVLAFQGEDSDVSRWAPVAKYLSSTIPTHVFSIVPLNNDNIDTAVIGGEVDFLLTNPASYADLESAFGVTRLLTVRNRRPGGAFTQFGAVIITRSDRTDIERLPDLRGKSFMAVHPNAFGGWWMAWRELKDQGVDPHKDFSRIEFAGFPQDKIVYAVLNGTIDAGTVRSDVLERLRDKGTIDLADFKVLNRQVAPGFPFLVSTRLYPEWPLSLVNQQLMALAQQVSVALLRMPEDSPEAREARIAGWTVPLDYHTVHDLMKELRVGPYKRFGSPSIGELLVEYWHWLVLALILIVASASVSIHVWRLNRRLKKFTHELEIQVAERTRAQTASASQAERIRALYSVASMPGLSFDEEIQEVLRMGCSVLGMELGRVSQIDIVANRTSVVSVYAPLGFQMTTGDHMPLDQTYCIIPSLTKQSVAIECMGQSKWRSLPCYTSMKLEAFIAAPIWAHQKFFGTLSFASRAARAVPFLETDRDLVQLIGRWIGVTLERRAQQREVDLARSTAESASRAKSEFLARMSHELRTPLNAIIGYSELLLDDDMIQSRKTLSDDVERILVSGKHLLALINDVLDLSKIEAGKMDLVYELISINGFIEDVAASVQPLALRNRNIFEIQRGDKLGQMTADVMKLRQTLFNLLSNAFKFTSNGLVTLRVERLLENGDEWLRIAVSDSGIGMNEEQQTRLFREFSQVSDDAVHNYGGTGLGLAISKRLCILMGGNIDVMSIPAKGTTFIARIPIHPATVPKQSNVKLATRERTTRRVSSS